MHKPSQKSLFELLNRLPKQRKQRQLQPAQQVVLYQPSCCECGRTISLRDYDSDFCPWCGHYGVTLPF